MKGKKIMILAGIVMAVLIANSFIPSLSATTKEKSISEKISFIPKDVKEEKVEIIKLGTTSKGTTLSSGNFLVSEGSEYDDYMPAVTTDDAGHIVVTWTQERALMNCEIGWAYSSDGSTWTGYATNIGEIRTYSDISWQDCKVYKGLFGIYFDETNLHMGFYTIPDITDIGSISIYYWTRETPDPIDACVADTTYLEGQYYDIHGPAAMYIYHFIYGTYDIPACPEQMITGFENGEPTSGEGTFDAQTRLLTAPADNPSMAGENMNVHYAWDYYNESLKNYQIVWKKIIPVEGDTESTDIEYTPYQKYIDFGRYPSISKSGNNVIIVYMNNDNIYGDWNIKCAYSKDDGATWETSIVAGTPIVDELYPVARFIGGTAYVAYVKEGNLYLVKSEDGGATWSEPEKVNDVDGSVVAEENCVDICKRGIVWVDNRNGNKDIYFSPIPAAIINIDAVSGGFGVKATVSNVGTIPANNVAWSIDLEGGLIILGKHAEGTIPTLAPGASTTISSGLVLGFGKTTIKVNAGGAVRTASGFVLGPFVLGVS
ncbi:MAG: exo-alpha-sialidase [Thermoplasmatales archaeon]|nr:exo-alpha-sialidase [Thermoplasmatales archaeon]